MRISHYLNLISYIFWLLPIFKQKGTEYFSVFYVLAIADPMRIIIYSVFSIYAYKYFPLFSFIILMLLVPKSLKVITGLIGAASIILINLTHIPRSVFYLETSFTHLLISLIICYRFFIIIKEKKAVNVFLMMFFSYEFITVYKLWTLSFLTKQTNASYNLSSLFQFFFAIAFTFINVNTKSFSLKPFIGEREEDLMDA